MNFYKDKLCIMYDIYSDNMKLWGYIKLNITKSALMKSSSPNNNNNNNLYSNTQETQGSSNGYTSTFMVLQ
jgi:hypothetical protein